MDELTRLHREFLEDSVRLRFDFSTTAQNRGLPPPPLQRPVPPGARTIELLGAAVARACLGQRFVAEGAATCTRPSSVAGGGQPRSYDELRGGNPARFTTDRAGIETARNATILARNR